MSSGDKSKTSSQTDGKAAQSKKSEMGMMAYKVGGSHIEILYFQFIISQTLAVVVLTHLLHLSPLDVRVRPGELPGSHDRDQQRVHECV